MKVIVILRSPEWFRFLQYENELFISDDLPVQEKMEVIEAWLAKEKGARVG